MDDFPIWVQLLPKVLFSVIVAKEGEDIISSSSLKNFYQKFAGLTDSELEKTTQQGFKTATAVSFYKNKTEFIFKIILRMETTSLITRVTNCCFPTIFWVRQSMVLENTCLESLTTEILLSSTRSFNRVMIKKFLVNGDVIVIF